MLTEGRQKRRCLIGANMGSCSEGYLLQPSVDSSLKITNRSFRLAAPHFWKQLPPTPCVPYHFDRSSSPSSSPSSGSGAGSLVGVSRGVFHSHLKTFLFSKSFPPKPSIPSPGCSPGIRPLADSLFGSHWRW